MTNSVGDYIVPEINHENIQLCIDRDSFIHSSLPKTIFYNHLTADNLTDIFNLFCNFFKIVYTSSQPISVAFDKFIPTSIPLRSVKIFHNLNVNVTHES